MADEWNVFRVTGIHGDDGEPGSDGDLGVLTLSFDEETINVQGNGQDTGYLIYNNTKFYTSGSFTSTTSGDGVIIADIRTSPATLHFKKLSVDSSVLSFVDFNDGVSNPITKAEVDSVWEYIMIGEFSCLNDGTIINATIKPSVSVTIFLSNSFTTILKNNAFTPESMNEWAVAMGCDQYYGTLAVSTLFAGEIFTRELTLTEDGAIKSSDKESVIIQANGLAKFKNLILEFGGNTMFKVDSTTGNVNFGYDDTGSPLFYYEQSKG